MGTCWPYSLLDTVDTVNVIKIGTGANVTKLFTSVICEFLKQARVFVHGKLFKPSLTNTQAYYWKVISLSYFLSLERLAMEKHSGFQQGTLTDGEG
jgi:hypothetical protein